MQILVIGHVLNLEELKQKFGPQNNYKFVESGGDVSDTIHGADVVFDFNPNMSFMKATYSQFENPVFLNTSLISLTELFAQANLRARSSFFGFCGLPTFFNRPVLELSIGPQKDEILLKSICSNLATDFVCVDDRVGLVTPRVVCMIINEAYYTLEEGTASREDIDLAMKLGTNYPYGPFEWASRIGIKNVIELLEAVYNDTQDDRYQICPLLKRE
ncbi:MAG: hypothetical protein RI909_1351 [Bacteroidota bacterium]|jgi:3-hydroxybutyryl-CoA dehydrogenase